MTAHATAHRRPIRRPLRHAPIARVPADLQPGPANAARGERSRARIVEALRQHGATTTLALAPLVGMTYTITVRHLRHLRAAGVVRLSGRPAVVSLVGGA